MAGGLAANHVEDIATGDDLINWIMWELVLFLVLWVLLLVESVVGNMDLLLKLLLLLLWQVYMVGFNGHLIVEYLVGIQKYVHPQTLSVILLLRIF